jgi:hypothetical protein
MATRDSKLKARSGRNRPTIGSDKGKPPAPPSPGQKGRARASKSGGSARGNAVEERLIEIFDDERTQLAQAEAILDCLYVALAHADEEDDQDSSGPYFPPVADIARKLVRGAVRRLDSLYLRPRLKKAMAAAAAM